MSISPLNGGTIIQFPRTHVMPMTLNQAPSMTINPANAAAHVAAAQAQQCLAVTDSTIAKRNATNAQKRANHNAIERARRECLNSKFQELARSIPALAQVRRPSKSVIVQKSLDYIYGSKQRIASRARELRNVKSENQSLREEVSRLRKSLGMAPLPERAPSASPEPEELATPDHSDAVRANYESNLGTPSNASFSELKREHDEDDDEEEVATGETEDQQQEEGLSMTTTPGYVTVDPTGARTMDPATTAQMQGFLDYMNADLSGGLNGISTDFASSPIGFPSATQAAQAAAAGIDIYNSPLSLASSSAIHANSPQQQIFLPSPCEDVFSVNELMNGRIEPLFVEPLQIQTPPQQ